MNHVNRKHYSEMSICTKTCVTKMALTLICAVKCKPYLFYTNIKNPDVRECSACAYQFLSGFLLAIIILFPNLLLKAHRSFKQKKNLQFQFNISKPIKNANFKYCNYNTVMLRHIQKIHMIQKKPQKVVGIYHEQEELICSRLIFHVHSESFSKNSHPSQN